MNPKRKHRILAVSAPSSSFQRRVRNSVSNNVIYTNKKASPSIPNAAIRVESDDVGAKDALSERTLKKYASATSAASTPNSQQKNDGSNRRIGGCPMSIRRRREIRLANRLSAPFARQSVKTSFVIFHFSSENHNQGVLSTAEHYTKIGRLNWKIDLAAQLFDDFLHQ